MRKILALVFVCLLLTRPVWAYGSFQAPLTAGHCALSSGTVGTSAIVELAAIPVGQVRGFLQIQNPSATASLAYTLDGSTPAVNGNGFTLGPLGSATYDTWVSQDSVTIIGSGASTPWTICVGQ